MAFNLEENGGPLRKGVVKQDRATGRSKSGGIEMWLKH